ncbi:unnamed protein product [Zymoseptoria tritici ST99CH_1A5]|uniref:Uncharacterized protein n=1 Tax=Zymoseptoria tritici ST99CH_1A5 TaxID=1276529 RepID=A0A1Y6LYG4_ZYMTR|nr:unnamed protein product [Zymoseptoria tritici ST99CH_1A5]
MGIIQKIEEKLGGNKSTATDDVNNTSNVHSSSTHPTTGSSNLTNPTSTSTTGHGTSDITGGTSGEGSHLASHNQKHDGLTGSHGAQHLSATSALPGSHSSNVHGHTLNPTTGHQTTGTVGGQGVGQGSHSTGHSQQHSGMPGSFPAEHTSATSALPHGSHTTSTNAGSHIPGTAATGAQQGSVLPGHGHDNVVGSHASSTHAGSHIPGTATSGSHQGSVLPGHGHDNVIGNQTSHSAPGQTGLTGSHDTNTTSGLRNETHPPHGAQTSSHHAGTAGHSHDNATTSTHNNQSGGGMAGLLNRIPGIGNKNNDKHAHDSNTYTSTRGPEEGVGGHHVSSGPGQHNTLSSNTAHNTPAQPFDPYSSEGQRTALNASNDAHHDGAQHRKSSIKPVSGPHATLENHSAIPTAGGVKVGDGPFEQDRSYDPTAKTAHITSDASGNSHPNHGHGHQTGPDNRGMMDKAKDTLSSKRTNHPDDPITGTNFDQKNAGGLTGSHQTHGLQGQSVHQGGLTGASHSQTGHSGLGSSDVHQSGLNDHAHSGLSGSHGQMQPSHLGSSNVHQGGLTGGSHGGLSSDNHGQTQHSALGHSGNLTSGTSANQPLAHDQSFADRHAPGVGSTTGNVGHSTTNPLSSHNQSHSAVGGMASNTGNPLSSNDHFPSSNIPQVQSGSHNNTANPLTTHNASSNIPGTQSHSTAGGVGHSSANPLSNTHDNASGGHYQAGYNDAMARQQAEQSRRL